MPPAKPAGRRIDGIGVFRGGDVERTIDDDGTGFHGSALAKLVGADPPELTCVGQIDLIQRREPLTSERIVIPCPIVESVGNGPDRLRAERRTSHRLALAPSAWHGGGFQEVQLTAAA